MKNTRSMMTKLAVAVVAMTCLLCVPQTLMAQKVEAATKNQKAHTAYDKRISYYKRQGYRNVSYQYVDIVGDSVDEAVVTYTGKTGDSKQYLRILDYSGKVNRLLLYKESPTMRKLLAYKKSSSIIDMLPAHSRYLTPSGVSLTGFVLRSKRLPPISFSMLATITLSEGCAMWSALAARRNPPSW